MTVGEEWKDRCLKSDNCHIIDGIYYYSDYLNSAVVLKAEPYLRNIIIPETVTFPDNRIIPVERIDYIAFAGTDIESVTIPKTCVYLGQAAFRDCKKLKSVKFNGNLEYINEECFSGCESIETIILPKYVGKITRGCFQGCTCLKEFVLPENVTEIESTMFMGCTNLLRLELQANITKIGYCSFEGCTGLKEIVFGENIVEVGWEAFKNCANLERITIKNNETKLSTLCFYGCTSLHTLVLPSNRFPLEDTCFVGCTKLDEQNLYYHTEFGDDLRRKWKEEVKAEKHRQIKKKWWYPIWTGAQGLFFLALLIPIGLIGFALFSVFAQTFTAIAIIVFVLLAAIGIAIAIFEHFVDGRVSFDYGKIMSNDYIIIAIFVISAIITIWFAVRLLILY